jgi:hypothetical protein
MSELRFRTVNVLDCHDLTKFVTELLGVKWDALRMRARTHYEGAGQDTHDSFNTRGESWQDEDAPTVADYLAFDRSVVDHMEFRHDFQRNSWLDDNVPALSAESVVRYLVAEGHLPSGEYLIHYWW